MEGKKGMVSRESGSEGVYIRFRGVLLLTIGIQQTRKSAQPPSRGRVASSMDDAPSAFPLHRSPNTSLAGDQFYFASEAGSTSHKAGYLTHTVCPWIHSSDIHHPEARPPPSLTRRILFQTPARVLHLLKGGRHTGE